MEPVYPQVDYLDRRCYDQLSLNEDILMEHAALGISDLVRKQITKGSNVLIVCGPGNNGADGMAAARQLHPVYHIRLVLPYGAKSKMAKRQLKRAKALSIEIHEAIELEESKSFSIVIDCLFGSGLSKALDNVAQSLVNQLNQLSGDKLACDLPSGVDINGKLANVAFNADTTITMGALKTALFSDMAKDVVGKIKIANLGVDASVYQLPTNVFRLTPNDLKLPLRQCQNSHKGTYGHCAVIVGNKPGAALMTAQAAFTFGAGLVSAIGHAAASIPPYIMHDGDVPQNANVLAVGMGLGPATSQSLKQQLALPIPKVIDADLFYQPIILTILEQPNLVLTPHPKEFCQLLALCDIAQIDVQTLQQNRFNYVEAFNRRYPHVVLLLKGANTLITYNNKFYINDLGSAALAKGGSGDVLAGLIAALLAQGYHGLDAAISGSLAHALAIKQVEKQDYAITPLDIINGVSTLTLMDSHNE